MQGLLFLAFIALGCLFAHIGLWHFFLAPDADRSLGAIVWFLFCVSPLLASLPGLYLGRVLSTFFLCMASLLYFTHGVVVAFVGPMAFWGWLEIVFALWLCTSTALLVRRLREAEPDRWRTK